MAKLTLAYPAGHIAQGISQKATQWGVSLVVHVIVLLVLAAFSIELESRPVLQTVISDLKELTTPEEFQEELTPDDELMLDAPVALTASNSPGSIAQSTDSLMNPIQSAAQTAAAQQAIGNRNLIRPLTGAVGSLGLETNISGLKGISEMVGAGGDAGVMDRITMEIMRQLNKNKVVVAWVMDSSASLAERRETIADRFDRIYKELEELGVNENDGLLTSVVSVGQDTRFLLDKPTNDVARIRKAIRSIGDLDDKTGVEALFTAVRETALRLRRFQTSARRSLLIVLLTDEIGDDLEVADETVQLLKRNGVPLYAMGPMATFSRPVIHDHWVDKETGFHFWIPMKRGPFTREEEVLRVPFNSRPYLSGFGPFAMTQVTRETGGIFFLYGDDRVRGDDYEPEILMRYKANYGPPEDYLAEINGSPMRRALMNVAADGNRIWSTSWPSPWIHAKTINRDIEARQQQIARFIDYANKAIPQLEAVESEWTNETDLRWRANFDFTHARLLQAKVRADEFNWACADFKANPRTLKDPIKNNGWHYRLTDTVNIGTQPGLSKKEKTSKSKNAQTNIKKSDPRETEAAKAMLEKALKHFQRVIDLHPGTPWAYAARIEKNRNVGIDWQEARNPNFIPNDDPERRKKFLEAQKRVPKK